MDSEHKPKTSSSQTQPVGGETLATKATTETPAKSSKPPPIVIENQSTKKTIELVEEKVKLKDFFIKTKNENKHILYAKNYNDFTKIKEQLNEAKTNYYTYTPREEKLQTVMLKGLDNTFSEKEILEELKTKETVELNFKKIVRFETRKSKLDNKQLPLFLVQLTADSKLNKLKEIKTVGYHIIKWDKIRKTDSIQCKNCQRLGHTASNCKMQYRCVKCSENHKPKECKLNKENKVDKDKLFCINCNKFGHPASYRGCPTLLGIKKIHTREKQEALNKRNKKIQSIENYVNDNISFAYKTKEPQITIENIRAQNNNSSQKSEIPDKEGQRVNFSNKYEILENKIEQIFLEIKAQLYNFKSVIEVNKNNIEFLFGCLSQDE